MQRKSVDVGRVILHNLPPKIHTKRLIISNHLLLTISIAITQLIHKPLTPEIRIKFYLFNNLSWHARSTMGPEYAQSMPRKAVGNDFEKPSFHYLAQIKEIKICR